MLKVFNQTPPDLGIQIEKLLNEDLQVVVIQADEAWFFVSNKANKCWI